MIGHFRLYIKGSPKPVIFVVRPDDYEMGRLRLKGFKPCYLVTVKPKR